MAQMTYTGKAETPQTIFNPPTPTLSSYQSGENIQVAGEMGGERCVPWQSNTAADK
jgi:hypothetical protein